jgi:hypothetical protein
MYLQRKHTPAYYKGEKDDILKLKETLQTSTAAKDDDDETAKDKDDDMKAENDKDAKEKPADATPSPK